MIEKSVGSKAIKMSRKSKVGGKKGLDGGDEDGEVDMLLRAAEDELLLNLSINSHTSHGVSQNTYIDPDLDRRFQALRSSRRASDCKPPPPAQSTADDKKRFVDSSSISNEDDLFARFAALKTSLPSSSSSLYGYDPQRPNKLGSGNEQPNQCTIETSDEDEVQKVIRWAIDAARLDPSPPTDSDDDGNVDTDTDGDSDDYSHDHQRKKAQRKKK